MTAPDPGLDVQERRVRRQQSRLIPLAYAALLWERLWPRLWPPVGIGGVFVALALFDVLPMLPFWLHGIVLAGFTIALVWSLFAGLRDLHQPTPRETSARIERDSRLSHRPLVALDDEEVSGTNSPATSILWAEHKRRAAEASKRLRVGVPSPGLARFDPFGLRVAVALALIIAFAAANNEAGVRMARALVPVDRGFAEGMRVDLWVTPPAYTGYPPYHVSKSGAQTTEGEGEGADFVEVRTIPVGSTVLAQVGSDEEPSLLLAERALPFEPIGTSGYRLETKAVVSDVTTEVSRIAIQVDERDVASWPVRIIDDAAPTIEFTQPPSNAGRGRLRVAFRAEDDFGLSRAVLVLRNPILSPEDTEIDTHRIDLPLSRARALTIETAVVRDLSEHDWAGLQTELRLETYDALGQIGRSEIFPMVLPERIFNHPVARALNEYRKKLVVPDEADVQEVIAGLEDLSLRPEHFNHDTVVFLALSVARARLDFDGSPAVMKSLRRLLWSTAIRIEDGEFALAGRELTDVQDALDQALQDGEYSDALEELLDALTKALDRFLAALGDELKEKGMEGLGDIPGLSYLDEEDLKSLIEDARELARTGSMDAAQATLDELRNLLNSIEAAMSSDSPNDEFSEVREMMEQLAAISRDQQGLLDETFRQMRRAQGADGEPGASSDAASGGGDSTEGEGNSDGAGELDPGQMAQSYAPQQLALRKDLGDLMLDLDQLIGMLPESLNQAKMAMKRAVDSLVGADPGGAVGHQSKALQELRESMEEVAEQVAQRLRAMPGNLPSAQGTLPNTGNDPFGRMGGGAMGSRMDDGSVKVPSQMEMRRAREIYEELRRRAGNQKRPVIEREYIHRLLRQF